MRGPITEFAEQIFNKDSKQEPETMKSFVDSNTENNDVENLESKLNPTS